MGAPNLETEIVTRLIQPLANKTNDPNYSPRQLGIDLFQGLNSEHHRAQQQGLPFTPQLLSNLSNTFSTLISQDDNEDKNKAYQNSATKTFSRLGTFLSIIDQPFANSQLDFMLTQTRSKKMDLMKQAQAKHLRAEEEEEFLKKIFEEEDIKEREVAEQYEEAELKWLTEDERRLALIANASEQFSSNAFNSYAGFNALLKPNPILDPKQPGQQNEAENKLKTDFQTAASSLQESLRQNTLRTTLQQGEEEFRSSFQNNLNTMRQNYQTLVTTLHTLENNVANRIGQDNINAHTRVQAQTELQNWHTQNQTNLRQFFSTGQVAPSGQTLHPTKPTPADPSSSNANLQKTPTSQGERTQEQDSHQQGSHPFDTVRQSGVQKDEDAPSTPRSSPFSTATPKPTDPPHHP